MVNDAVSFESRSERCVASWYWAGAARAALRIYPFGHFDMYHGAAFAQVVEDQVTSCARTVVFSDR
jgi:hypothetical protein